jgi:hypothetical protein
MENQPLSFGKSRLPCPVLSTTGTDSGGWNRRVYVHIVEVPVRSTRARVYEIVLGLRLLRVDPHPAADTTQLVNPWELQSIVDAVEAE